MSFNDRYISDKPRAIASWIMSALVCATLMSFGLSSAATACGPSAPLTSAELLAFQVGLIDRGIAREALTTEQRADIAKLRADIEAYQKADKHDDAREAMKKIVAMFKYKEMMGAVEPIVPGCAPIKSNVVSGTLVAIDIEPNVAGARCGNHYVLSIKGSGVGGKVAKLNLYDLAKAPFATLKAMLNKRVEVDTMGSGVVGLRLAETQQAAAAELSGLSPRKPC